MTVRPNNICLICKKPFYASPGHVKTGWGKYCSMKCYGKSTVGENHKNYKNTNVKCKGCGKLFHQKACATRLGKGKIYCSQECRFKHGSYLEKEFLELLKLEKLTEGMEREFRFHPIRKWRFDFAWPDKKWAVEIHGGIWLGKFGGHTSAEGRARDAVKHNEATLMGWKVLQFTKTHIRNGFAIELTKEALSQ